MGIFHLWTLKHREGGQFAWCHTGSWSWGWDLTAQPGAVSAAVLAWNTAPPPASGGSIAVTWVFGTRMQDVNCQAAPGDTEASRSLYSLRSTVKHAAPLIMKNSPQHTGGFLADSPQFSLQ